MKAFVGRQMVILDRVVLAPAYEAVLCFYGPFMLVTCVRTDNDQAPWAELLTKRRMMVNGIEHGH
ncbi:MAG TPA: hypothetical protein PLT48_18785 [Nitrospira sp.]|nr:hypothetical protein [Nitrospira sp.]HMZ56900.1 hypothetical protein [Nitrospira sp.]